MKEIADRLGATTAQVLVAWGVYRGYSVIPKSVKEGTCGFDLILLFVMRPLSFCTGTYYVI